MSDPKKDDFAGCAIIGVGVVIWVLTDSEDAYHLFESFGNTEPAWDGYPRKERHANKT